MATYLELYTLRTDTNLIQRISVAILVVCEAIRVEAANTAFHSNRVAWAQQAIKDPEPFAGRALALLLAQNKDSTAIQITGVSDSTIQTAVNGLINTLTGLN